MVADAGCFLTSDDCAVWREQQAAEEVFHNHSDIQLTQTLTFTLTRRARAGVRLGELDHVRKLHRNEVLRLYEDEVSRGREVGEVYHARRGKRWRAQGRGVTKTANAYDAYDVLVVGTV